MKYALLLTLGLAACSHAAVGPVVHQVDGSYRLSCSGPLTDCLRHAERLCRDAGYEVLRARDEHELFGHESGQSQVLVEKSQALVRCGGSRRAPAAAPAASEPAATAAATTSNQPSASSAAVCVAGATQACVGPGGCGGGQVCARDGSHFEPCDCGAAQAEPPPEAR